MSQDGSLNYDLPSSPPYLSCLDPDMSLSPYSWAPSSPYTFVSTPSGTDNNGERMERMDTSDSRKRGRDTDEEEEYAELSPASSLAALSPSSLSLSSPSSPSSSYPDLNAAVHSTSIQNAIISDIHQLPGISIMVKLNDNHDIKINIPHNRFSSALQPDAEAIGSADEGIASSSALHLLLFLPNHSPTCIPLIPPPLNKKQKSSSQSSHVLSSYGDGIWKATIPSDTKKTIRSAINSSIHQSPVPAHSQYVFYIDTIQAPYAGCYLNRNSPFDQQTFKLYRTMHLLFRTSAFICQQSSTVTWPQNVVAHINLLFQLRSSYTFQVSSSANPFLVQQAAIIIPKVHSSNRESKKQTKSNQPEPRFHPPPIKCSGFDAGDSLYHVDNLMESCHGITEQQWNEAIIRKL